MVWAAKVKERELFLQWLPLSTEQRVEQGLALTMAGEAKSLGVANTLVYKWKRRAEAAAIIEPTTLSEQEQADALFLKELTRDVTAPHSKTSDRLLYATIRKMIPKTNIDLKISLSADEIARRNLEATKQLTEGGY